MTSEQERQLWEAIARISKNTEDLLTALKELKR